MAAVLMVSVVFPSCVAKKKYLAAKSANTELSNRNQGLTQDLSAAQDSISKLRGNVNTLNDVYNSTNAQLNMSKEQIIEQQKRLAQLQDLITRQQRSTEAIRKKIADALVNFNTNELSVSMKNGKVYVSMQESLLFPSGSAVVNKKGKEALAKVAGVLNTNPDINVEVEGHTDSVPIKTTMYPDNWALSVARATSISRVMMNDYSVPANRIKASGRSQYDPVATNETTEGRAQNRRTEIILEPKLDELMQLIRGVPVERTKP
jgi:chemotaxis protein MotB